MMCFLNRNSSPVRLRQEDALACNSRMTLGPWRETVTRTQLPTPIDQLFTLHDFRWTSCTRDGAIRSRSPHSLVLDRSYRRAVAPTRESRRLTPTTTTGCPPPCSPCTSAIPNCTISRWRLCVGRLDRPSQIVQMSAGPGHSLPRAPNGCGTSATRPCRTSPDGPLRQSG